MFGYHTLLRRLRSRKAKSGRRSIDARIESREDLERWVLWSSFGESLTLHVAVEHLVMQGGLRYADASHPFVAALTGGAQALGTYYEACQPRSFCEFHDVRPQLPSDVDVPCWELPWLQREQRLPPPGEGGLGPEHGLSYCGPVSPEKLRLEYARLTELKQRVVQDGYRPDLYGHITGFFMVDDGGRYRFFVRGGKHRTAVLAHLGLATIPVTFKRDWPRVVRERDARYWPLVQNAALSETAARAAFRRYTT